MNIGHVMIVLMLFCVVAALAFIGTDVAAIREVLEQ